ncbi:hypothetical protein QVD17_38973 [Tagetes erecta]|uniref:TPM domain-containing protein n=1 Tax=Tagetes erecta TaxID=13708 RepID=A0AAD8NES0_TARER|nr:hypothetical protein QVD17_38973 [Tagetes erecta]
MAVASPCCCCRIATSSHFPSLPSTAFHRLTKQHTPLQFTSSSSTHTYITLKPRVSPQFHTISPPSSSQFDCVYPSNGEADCQINVQQTKPLLLSPFFFKSKVDAFEYADQVLERWYPTLEEGNNKGIVVPVTSQKEGAITGGPEFIKTVGDTVLDDVVSQNLPVLATDEKYNEAIYSSAKRLAAAIDGLHDPGGPEPKENKRESNFKTKEETAENHNQFTIVGGGSISALPLSQPELTSIQLQFKERVHFHKFSTTGNPVYSRKEYHGLTSKRRICKAPRCSNSDGATGEPSKKTKVPFGYSRKDVILIGFGVTFIGIGLKSGLEYLGVDPLQAGNVVQLVLVLGLTIGWISTYLFRVSNKEMTYAQQLRDYEMKVMEKRLEGLTEAELEALLEQVEEEKRLANKDS